MAQDVPSPTTNLRLSGSLSDIADKRRTDPESLVRQMRGDLDAIVMKSIEASRDRRYQTPTELADDLLRSLRHEPVTARMATRSYRFRKFVRRNRAAVMFSAGLAVALLVGLAGTGIGYFRAQRALAEERIQRGIADGALQAESAQRLQAQADARAARTANEFLTDLFTHSDPILQVVKYGEIQSELRVRDLLKRAAESIPGRFESEPLTAATLHLMIGNGFYGIHDPKAAVEQFKLAESLYERSCGPEHLLTLTARVDLARTLGMSGQPADAEILLRDVLPRLRLLGDEADHVFRIGEMVLVHVLSQRGKTEEAEAMIARLLDLPSATTNRSAALQQIAALNQVANVLIASGKYPRAENLTEKALALATAHGFLPTPLGVQVRLNRSSVLRARGKLDEAEPILRAAIASSETINGPRHRDTVQALGNLTILLNARGRPEDLANAARVAGQIYGIAKEINGLKHFQTITAGINLGILEINRNASKGAIPVLREILGPARDLAGPRSIYATTILVALGRALTDVGEAVEAEPLIREAIAAMEKSIPGDWRIPQAECCLGRALVSQRKTADGVSLLEAGVRKLVERKDKMPKQDHSLIRIAVQWLIEAYRASGQSGKVAEAESAYREFLTQPK